MTRVAAIITTMPSRGGPGGDGDDNGGGEGGDENGVVMIFSTTIRPAVDTPPYLRPCEWPIEFYNLRAALRRAIKSGISLTRVLR